MKEGGVYQIINKVNGKRYVGSAVNLHRRQNQHWADLHRSKHRNDYLQKAWHLYGSKAFAFAVLEYVPDLEQLLAREQHYMDVLAPEYNIAPVAGSHLGAKRSEETKQKMSAAKMGHVVSEASRQKTAEANRGRVHSAATRAKMSRAQKNRLCSPEQLEHCRRLGEARRGKPHTEKTKAKMSKAHQGKVLSEETRQKLSLIGKGRAHSAESIAKMSKAKRGKPLGPMSEEHKRKIAAANLGKVRSPEQREHLSKLRRGENASGAKLTDQAVREIKVLLAQATLTQSKIAARFGVVPSVITNIKHGHTWSHVSVEGEVKAA